MIGSTETGKTLVTGWNTFYYSWSPPIAKLITQSETLQTTFRILLIPLVAIIHSTAFLHSTIATVDLVSASIIAFVHAALLSIIFYILTPILILRILYRKISILKITQ
jgi:hypothetical protein